MQVCVIDNKPAVPCRPLTDVEKMQIEIKRIKEFMQHAEDVAPDLIESVMILSDIVNSLDNANDFYKIGGYDLLLPLLEMPQSEILAVTAELIADLVQNNSFCQQKALECGVVDKLVDLLKTTDALVCAKALYAVSCLSRHNHQSIEHLERLNVVEVLLEIMQRPVERLRTKTAFFLTHLIRHESRIRDIIYKTDFIQIVIKLLKEEYAASHEHLLSALLGLVESHVRSREECCREEYDLRTVLENNLARYGNASEYQEVADYCKKLKSVCFPE